MPESWTYVDDRRTHEVRAAIEVGRTAELVVTERAFGGAPAAETYVERHTITERWEVKMRVLALETKLALLGSYYKAAPGGWTPVRLAAPRAPPDLAALDVGDGSGMIEFHHFTSAGGDAASLVGVHQDLDGGRRSLLVRVEYRPPNVAGGKLKVVHATLTPSLYRSALMGAHLELAQRGFAKSMRDQRKFLDERGWLALRETLDAILACLIDNVAAKLDGLTDGKGRPLDARHLVKVVQAAKASKGAASAARAYEIDFEIDGPARPVEAKKPDVRIEELPADVFGALREPRLVALHARFMTPQREADLFSRGERAIGIAMRELRGSVRPDEQHLVSLLEASLLLRYALQKRIPVDPDVIKRVQHARAYL